MKQELLTEKCNEFMDEVMNLNDLPGLAVGVSIGDVSCAVPSDDLTEFVGVRGCRDYAAREPLKEDSVFHCASVSKLFTSSAIMKLVEAGALRLDDRLCEMLPDLNIADKRFEEIRLWNMLTHTSGLGDVDDYRWYDFETDDDSLRRYVYESEEVLTQPMLWDPRETRFRYSNIAYEILGQIVSECSGLSYEDFVSRYLLEPAGMSSSTMKTFERAGAPDFKGNERMALPHEKSPTARSGLLSFIHIHVSTRLAPRLHPRQETCCAGAARI